MDYFILGLSELQHMYLLTLIPKAIVTRLSLWLIGCGKKRQHRLLSPLHLENCVREKKSAAAAPMHACLNDSHSTLAVFRKKSYKATSSRRTIYLIWKAKVPGANASLVPLGRAQT